MIKICYQPLLYAACIIHYGCGAPQSKTETKDATVLTTEENTPLTFKDSKADSIYNAYINLKNALIANQEEDATKATAYLEAILKTSPDSLAIQASKLGAAANIAEKRLAFNDFSENILKELRGKIKSGTIYKQHCPMANDGKGGFWLASEKEIRNPYYGEAMLSCGTVEEQIK